MDKSRLVPTGTFVEIRKIEGDISQCRHDDFKLIERFLKARSRDLAFNLNDRKNIVISTPAALLRAGSAEKSLVCFNIIKREATLNNINSTNFSFYFFTQKASLRQGGGVLSFVAKLALGQNGEKFSPHSVHNKF